MTLENWQQIMFNCFRSQANKFISVLYLFSWIFVGNYILLNLFLAILLDGFGNLEDEQIIDEIEDDSENFEKIKQQNIENMQKKVELMNKKNNLNNNYPMTKYDNSNKIFPIDSPKIFERSSSLIITNKSTMKITSLSQMNQFHNEDNLTNISVDLDEFNNSGFFTVTEKVFKYFEDNECQDSFFYFSTENYFRRKCYRIVKYPKFDTFILIMIIISSIKLALDTYITNPKSLISTVSNKFDLFFTIVFTIEALMKACALGFVLDKGSYLRENWSQLDFLIVCFSLIDVAFENADLTFIKILRLIRILRPLRFISHNENMKIVVIALMQSVGAIFNVVIVILMIWFNNIY